MSEHDEFDDFAEGLGSESDAQSAIGALLFDPNTEQPLGFLFQSPAHNGLAGATYFTDANGNFVSNFTGGVFLTGDRRLINLNSQGGLIFEPRNLSLAAPSGGGGGGISFEQQRTLQREAQENATRRDLIAAATSLSERRAADVAEARRLTVSLLGSDPLAAAAAMQGQAQIGVTPTSAFGNQLETFINAPTQNVDPFAPTDQLNQQVGALRQQVGGGVPQSAFGLAHGGVIDMKKNERGAFEPDLNPSTGAILVGEGPNGEGLAAGTAEVIITEGDGRLRVVPLTGMAQGGGTFSPSSLANILSPVFSHLGLSGTPVIGRQDIFGRAQPNLTSAGTRSNDPFGPVGIAEDFGRFPTPSPGLAAETFSALGTTPRFARLPNGIILMLQDGQARPLGSTPEESIRTVQRLQIQPSSIVNLQPQEVAELGFGQGSQLTSMPTVRNDLAFGQPIPGPLVDPVTGILAPDPRLIASLLRPGALDPGTQNVIRQFIDRAIGAEGATEARAFAFTPTGTAFQGQQTGLA